MKSISKSPPQLAETFIGTFEGCRVRNADADAVTRVIAVRHDQVGVSIRFDEPIQQKIVGKRVALPDPVAKLPRQKPPHRTTNASVGIIPALLLRRSGVVDVTDDGETNHDAMVRFSFRQLVRSTFA